MMLSQTIERNGIRSFKKVALRGENGKFLTHTPGRPGTVSCTYSRQTFLEEPNSKAELFSFMWDSEDSMRCYIVSCSTGTLLSVNQSRSVVVEDSLSFFGNNSDETTFEVSVDDSGEILIRSIMYDSPLSCFPELRCCQQGESPMRLTAFIKTALRSRHNKKYLSVSPPDYVLRANKSSAFACELFFLPLVRVANITTFHKTYLKSMEDGTLSATCKDRRDADKFVVRHTVDDGENPNGVIMMQSYATGAYVHVLDDNGVQMSSQQAKTDSHLFQCVLFPVTENSSSPRNRLSRSLSDQLSRFSRQDTGDDSSKGEESSSESVCDIFGLSIQELKDAGKVKNGIPLILDKSLCYIEECLSRSGVSHFSEPFDSVTLCSFREGLACGSIPESFEFDPEGHDVALAVALVKMFFRELPEPVLTFERRESFLRAASTNNAFQRLQQLKAVAESFSTLHSMLFHSLFGTLHRLCQRLGDDAAKLSSVAIQIAVSIAPIVVGPIAREEALNHSSFTLVHTLITSYDKIFTKTVSERRIVQSIEGSSPSRPVFSPSEDAFLQIQNQVRSYSADSFGHHPHSNGQLVQYGSQSLLGHPPSAPPLQDGPVLVAESGGCRGSGVVVVGGGGGGAFSVPSSPRGTSPNPFFNGPPMPNPQAMAQPPPQRQQHQPHQQHQHQHQQHQQHHPSQQQQQQQQQPPPPQPPPQSQQPQQQMHSQQPMNIPRPHVAAQQHSHVPPQHQPLSHSMQSGQPQPQPIAHPSQAQPQPGMNPQISQFVQQQQQTIQQQQMQIEQQQQIQQQQQHKIQQQQQQLMQNQAHNPNLMFMHAPQQPVAQQMFPVAMQGNFNLPPADAVAVHPAALASGQIPFAQAVQYQEERPSWLLRESEIQLTKKIGAGCYGEVFKGEWAGIKVAVKKITKPGITKQDLESFKQEIDIMSQLRHPNVVPFLGACFDNEAMLVTEYMERGCLRDVLADQTVQLSWSTVLNFAADIAKGLSYLHTRNPPVVHRDIKSFNILVTKDWKAVVSDFGLTKIKSLSYLDSFVGSPAWSAPEVLRGERYDEKADVFSFGVVMWELLTRQLPYVGMTSAEVIRGVGYTNPPLRPPIPGGLRGPYHDLMIRCWHQDPAYRPHFTEVLHVLKNNLGAD